MGMLTEQFIVKQFFICDYPCSLLFMLIITTTDAHMCSLFVFIVPL
jgi:hypothetical protein